VNTDPFDAAPLGRFEESGHGPKITLPLRKGKIKFGGKNYLSSPIGPEGRFHNREAFLEG